MTKFSYALWLKIKTTMKVVFSIDISYYWPLNVFSVQDNINYKLLGYQVISEHSRGIESLRTKIIPVARPDEHFFKKLLLIYLTAT
jgi:hypothetical protein